MVPIPVVWGIGIGRFDIVLVSISWYEYWYRKTKKVVLIKITCFKINKPNFWQIIVFNRIHKEKLIYFTLLIYPVSEY